MLRHQHAGIQTAPSADHRGTRLRLNVILECENKELFYALTRLMNFTLIYVVDFFILYLKKDRLLVKHRSTKNIILIFNHH